MSLRLTRLWLAACGTLLMMGATGRAGAATAPSVPLKKIDSLALLLPDTANLTDPRITIWTGAIAEEGLPLAILRDADFLKPGFDATQYAGVILPDQVHVTASDER